MKGLQSDDNVNGFLGHEWVKRQLEKDRIGDYSSILPSLDEIIMGLVSE